MSKKEMPVPVDGFGSTRDAFARAIPELMDSLVVVVHSRESAIPLAKSAKKITSMLASVSHWRNPEISAGPHPGRPENPEWLTWTKLVQVNMASLKSLEEVHLALDSVPSSAAHLSVGSQRPGAKYRWLDLLWLCHGLLDDDMSRSRPVTDGWGIPNDSRLIVLLRATQLLRLEPSERWRFVLELVGTICEDWKPYHGFVDFANLVDINAGHAFWDDGFSDRCKYIVREHVWWWSLPPEKRRRCVSGMHWGMIFGDTLLDAVNEKDPRFFEDFAKWRIPPFASLPSRKSDHHCVSLPNNCKFITMTEDPAHVSELHGMEGPESRLTKLMMWARARLSQHGLHA